MPSGYSYTGKTFEEFGEIMKRNAKKNYSNFIRNIDLKGVEIEEVYSLDKKEDPIKIIYDTAEKLKVDRIIFGAKGRSETTAIFIGSMAEKLISIDVDIPLMVVRPKGNQAGIIEYLKEI